MYYNMTADVLIFTLHNYSTVLLSLSIILSIRSLPLTYRSLQVCTLKYYHSYAIHPHHLLVTTILLCFSSFFEVGGGRREGR